MSGAPTKLREGRDEPILQPELPIIDAHQHFYDRPTMRYMFEEYLDDVTAGHNIVASVYIETLENARADGPEVLRPIGEVEFANGVAAMSASGRFGACRVAAAIVGHADLTAGDDVAELLDLALEVAPGRFRGIRHVTVEYPNDLPFQYFIMKQRPVPGTLTSAAFVRGLRHLAPRGLSFDASVFSNQLPDLASVAADFPETTIVLNHMGTAVGLGMGPGERKEVFEQWRRDLTELAVRHQNVVCKVGGLGMPFWGLELENRVEPIGYRELADLWRPYIETAIEAFGAERCMMESNYPPDGRSCGYVPLWNALKHITRDCSPSEQAALFHDTASRIYRI